MSLKVEDFINYPEKTFKNTVSLLTNLEKLVKEYISLADTTAPERLEKIKREFGGYLTSLASYYAIIRAFKYNGDYFEEERKRFKSEAIELIVDRDKMSTAGAEKIVYSEPYYKERVALMQNLKKFFIRVEYKYDRYRDTARDIYQSVSQQNQERRFSGDSGSTEKHD